MVWEHIRFFCIHKSCFLKICSVLFPLDSAGQYDDYSSHIFLLSIDGWESSLLLMVHKSHLVSNSHSNQIFHWRNSLIVESLAAWLGWIFSNFDWWPSPGFRRSCRTVQADRRLVDTWAEAVGWWWCFVCFVVPKRYGCRRSHHFKFIPQKQTTGEMLRKEVWLRWPSAYDRLQDAPRAAPRAERLLEEARTPWCTRWVCLLTRWILILGLLSFFG